MISDKQLQKFKAIYQKHLGVELSDEEAQEKGSKLVRLMEIIYKPMTKEEFAILEKRRKSTQSGPAQ